MLWIWGNITGTRFYQDFLATNIFIQGITKICFNKKINAKKGKKKGLLTL